MLGGHVPQQICTWLKEAGLGRQIGSGVFF
jgi:hypothetical protein